MSTGRVEAPDRAELGRKAIHVAASLCAAAVVWFLAPLPAALILATATLVALKVELLRRVSARFARRFHGWLGSMLRARESRRITGATTLAVGYTLAAVFFPGTPALLGILLTGVADAVAALVGKRFGRHRYPGGKSIEGSLGFFVVALAIVWSVSGTGPGPALALAALVTLLEAPTLPVDDNLYLPVVAAGAARGTSWLLLAQGFS